MRKCCFWGMIVQAGISPVTFLSGLRDPAVSFGAMAIFWLGECWILKESESTQKTSSPQISWFFHVPPKGAITNDNEP